MKLKNTKKQVIDKLIAMSNGMLTGYTPYDNKYFFTDGCAIGVFTNSQYGYSENLPCMKKQITRKEIDHAGNWLRPNHNNDVSEFDSDFTPIHFTYKQVYDWYQAAGREKREKKLKFRPSIKLGEAWYNSEYILRAMEMIANKYTDPNSDEFTAYVVASKGSLTAMWFFNCDGECVWVLPVKKNVEQGAIK